MTANEDAAGGAEQVIVAVIEAKFDVAMPDWWPPIEHWADDITAALRAAGLLPGPDDIVVSREDLAMMLAHGRPSNSDWSLAWWDAHRRLRRAALSQPHPAQEQQA